MPVCIAQADTHTQGTPLKLPSNWVVLARQADDLGRLPKDSRWPTCARSGKAPWTDDHTNVFAALDLT